MKLINNFRELGAKEFGRRWAEGIKQVSPAQQNYFQLVGNVITIIGILCGIGMSLLYFSKFWWGAVILVGALIVTGTSTLGLYQKYLMFKQMEMVLNNCKEVESNEQISTV